MKEKLLLLLILTISLLSCTKTVFEDNPPQLEITVLNFQLVRVVNAEVILYVSESDLIAEINAKSNSVTNAEGVAIFDNLDTEIYYINVIKDDYNHKETLTHGKEALVVNEMLKLTITINN